MSTWSGRKQQGRRVDYERYLELKVGGVKGSSDEGRVDLRERKRFLEAEPFLDLFGAGSSGIAAGSTVASTSAPPSRPSRWSRSF